MRNRATGRIDTTISPVAVQRGDSTSTVAGAARYVKDTFADEEPKILAIWTDHERDEHANPIFYVEWESGES